MSDGQTLNVVLPQAPGFNAGMAAVDLGLVSASRKLGFQVVPWRIGSLAHRAHELAPDLDSQMAAGLGVSELIGGRWPLDVEDPILFWGDFHHMANYVDDVGKIIGPPLGGHAAARRFLLLDGAAVDIKARSASFGTTLIFNSNQDFRNGPYAAALQDFLAHNAMTVFRDPISTALVRRFRPDGNISTGVDPALFLEPDQIPILAVPSGAVGVFFGRSSSTHEGLWKIAKRTAESMEVPLEWIDWGDTRGFPNMGLPQEIGFPEPPAADSAAGSKSRFMLAMAHMHSCSAVVTDSYHAALIAWRLGIPAITVSTGPSAARVSVNGGTRWSWRDKRELAASQYGALDLVVRSEELSDTEMLDQRISHVLDFVQDKEPMAFIRSQIEEETEIGLATLELMVARLARSQI